MNPKKTELIEKILKPYREKKRKPDDWFVEKFEQASDMGVERLENYLKVIKMLEK
jgi:hypothetical protein